jgi:pilus assembly protein Flp/PilA
MRTMKLLAEDEAGQDLIEYALVAALIALGAVVGVRSLAGVIGNMFTYVGTGITSAV